MKRCPIHVYRDLLFLYIFLGVYIDDIPHSRANPRLLASPFVTFASRLNWHSKASPERLPKASLDSFNPAVAASAALPALTMLAEDAEAKYGDNRKWSAVLVPLTTLASRWFWRRQKCRAERL